MARQFTKRHQETLLRAGRLRWAVCATGFALVTGAQAESAPFVFEENKALGVDTPGWVSDRDYLIGPRAFIDVSQEADGHIRGAISNVPGSPNGLVKLGAGTLRLSGLLSYTGGTHLRQGSLHADGSHVFGMGTFIEAVQGTTLEYSPGTQVQASLTLRNLDPSFGLPVALYTPVAPQPGLEDAMAWRVESGTATHTGMLHGSLPFVKLGAGQLNITGDAMPYTGQARVWEGTLAINEFFSGAIRVGPGARLHGTGSMAEVHIQNRGTLAPGNTEHASASAQAIGAIRVTGDLRFDPASRFEIDAAPTGEADFVWVGGKAFLGGDVSVLAQGGTWHEETAFPIVSAREGFEGTQFDGVSADLAFLTPSLQYSPDTVTLTLKRNDTPIGEVGETPDENEVGEVIDEGGGEVEETFPPAAEAPTEPDLRDHVLGLNREQSRSALRQLTGSWNASVLSSMWDSSRFVREAVLHQSNEMLGTAAAGPPLGDGGSALHTQWRGGSVPLQRYVGHVSASSSGVDDETAGKHERRLQTWVELFRSEQTRNAAAGVPGDSRSVDGFVLGMAAKLHIVWRLGAFLGAQKSSMNRDEGAADANIHSTHLGLHIAGHYLGLRLVLGAARSWHRIKTERLVDLGQWRDALSARYGGQTTQVFGEASMPLDLNFGPRRFTAAPFVQTAWVQTRFDGYTENGGPAALNAQPAAMKGWISTLGLRAEAAMAAHGGDIGRYGLEKGKIFAQVAWHHARYDQPRSVQAFRDSASQRLFSSQGIAPVRQAWSLRLGLDAPLTKTARLGFAYLGAYGKGQRDHGIGGWARIAF